MPDRPNILFVMTDQLRGDWLRCAGNDVIQTPHIDQIADEGTRFSRAFSECPVCIPARYTLMTGLYPETIDLRCNRNVHMPITETLPYMLGRAGYQTQSVGKLHFTPQRACYGFDNSIVCEAGRLRGGDDYHRWLATTPYADQERMHGLGNNMVQGRKSVVPESHHVTTWTVSQSLDYLDRRDPTRPFFLFTSFTKPHSPYDPPEPYDKMYDPDRVSDPMARDLAPDALPPSLRILPETYGWDRLSAEEIRQIRAHYMGEISHIDAQIGRLLGGLAWRGILNNTMVIFASDHGDMMGDRGLFFKTSFYEGSMHVPLIISLPRTLENRVPGRVVNAPVGLADLLPTILDFAGVEDVRAREGRSILGFARGEMPFEGRLFHSVYATDPNDARHCLTDGRTKYVWNRWGDVEELYSIPDDPEEVCNLATVPGHEDELSLWRTRLVARLKAEGADYCLDGDALSPWEAPLPTVAERRARDRFGRRDH